MAGPSEPDVNGGQVAAGRRPRHGAKRSSGRKKESAAGKSYSRPPEEHAQLLAYKNAALNNINTNHVNHRVVEDRSWQQGLPQPRPVPVTPASPPTRTGSTKRRASQGAPLVDNGNRRHPASVVLQNRFSDPYRKLSEHPAAVASTSSDSRQVLEVASAVDEDDDLSEHDCKKCGCERIRINVSGQHFETRVGLLNKHPDTLLGNPNKRQRFYDRTRDEFFIDRHRPSFEAVFSYFQNGGKLRRPHTVPDDIFLAEINFYELEKNVVDEYKEAEGYVEEEICMPTNTTMKKIWMLFEFPETSILALIIAVISVILTLVSIVLFCVETLPVFSMTHCVSDEAPNFLDPFFVIETTCTAWFTLEVIIRFIACPSKLAFWKDFKNIVDLTAIVPYYVTFFNVISTMSCASAKSSASLAFLRVIRLIRVFKLTKHSTGLQVLILTFKASIEGLGLFLVALMVCLLVFSSAIYYAELGRKDSEIDSIPDAFWWAIITMCTVGYGDKVPKGPWGRVIGAICAIVGVLTLAIPVPIITGNFNRFYSHKTGRGRHMWRTGVTTQAGHKLVGYIHGLL